MKTKQPLTDEQKVAALRALILAVVKGTHSQKPNDWLTVDKRTYEVAELLLGRETTEAERNLLVL